ncbi:MAG: hypothetical protein KAH20_02980 [Methylococcales bacterium]|nr:hypothetical protein [Methylococcales bacterium]
MSLLNQVLQDLEERNAESNSDQTKHNYIKAVHPTHKKSFLYVIIILLIIGMIAVISYFVMKEESSEIVVLEPTPPVSSVIQPQEPVTKTTTIVSSENALASQQISLKVDDLLPLPLASHQIPQAEAIQSIKKHSTDNKIQQPVKSATNKIKKNTQPNRIKPYKQQKRKVPKKLSSKQQAEKIFNLAKKQKNNTDKLKQVLQLNSKHVEARLLLSNNLLNLGMLNETAAILDKGLQLFPQNNQFINFRSQLLLQNKQPKAALSILQRINSGYNQNEMYLSLLAAAYQQNNENLNAIQIYQKLLLINHQKAEYWLGLAITLEKQGNKEQALNAYQHALNKKTLQKTIISYINQRVSLLK